MPLPSNIIPEINISYPNVKNTNTMYTDEYEILRNMLSRADQVYERYGVKISPTTSELDIQRRSYIFNLHPKLKFIVCGNSIGCSVHVDTRVFTSDLEVCTNLHSDSTHTGEVNIVQGGLSGLKYLNLGNVYLYSKYLKQKSIIGCGGVKTKKDVDDYLACGASAVQIASQLLVSNDILHEYIPSKL